MLGQIVRIGADISNFTSNISVVRGNVQRLGQDLNRELGQNASQGIETATGRIQSLGSGLSTIGKNLTASVTLPIVGIGIASIKAGADFEQGLSNIKAVSGATSQEMKQLSDLALKMGADTAFSAKDATKGIEELIKAGVSTKDILNGGLKGALDLAQAGELELGESAEIASTALNAFKVDALSVAEAGNILAGAANASATDVRELKFGLSMVSAVASGVGLSFKDTNTALAVFAQNGLKGSDAGTSLKTMLLNLQPKTTAQYDEFKRLGLMTYDTSKALDYLAKNGVKSSGTSFDSVDKTMRAFVATQSGLKEGTAKFEKEYQKMTGQLGISQSAFYDANGSLKSMGDIADLLQNKLTGMTDAQRQATLQTLFGTDAIRAGNILYKEGAKGLEDMQTSMSKVTASEVASEKMNNFNGSVEQLKGSLETLGIQIGTIILPHLKRLVDIATNVTNKFGEMSNVSKTFIIVVGGILAVLPPLVWGIGTLITTALKLKTAFVVVKTAMSGLELASLLNPVGLVIAGIALLSFGVYECYKHFDQLKEGFNNLSPKMKILAGIAVAMNPITAVVAGVTLAIKGVQYALADSIPPVQLFGKETSKATEEAVGAYMKLDNEAGQSLMNLKITGEKVSISMKTEMVKNFNDMGKQIKDGIGNNFDDSYKYMQDYFKNSKALSDKEEQEILTKKKATFDKQIKTVDDGTKQINAILSKASEEKRSLTETEMTTIEGIKEKMKVSAVKNLSETELESKAILERMAQQADELSAQQAVQVVKNSLEQKNKAVQSAEDQYNETIKNVIKMRDETGEITKEQADKLIAEATKQRDETIKKAEEMHSKVVTEAKNQAGEHVDQVNWETGEVLNNWEIFKSNVAKKWNEIIKSASDTWENIKKDTVAKWNEITIYVPQKIDEMKASILQKWTQIKTDIHNKIEEIKESIKNMFDVNIKIPNIPLPHFSATGSMNPLDWITNGVPKIGVNWYQTGGIADGASVVGIGEEVGVKEAILPLSGSHMKPFADTVAKLIGANGSNGSNQEFNFYSPKALNESEIQRNIREIGREQAMEWGLI